MTMPAFTAEASLYRTGNSYRSAKSPAYSRPGSVTPQLSCGETLDLCLLECAFGGGIFCAAGCFINLFECLGHGSSGGGGGGPPSCCGPGAFCGCGGRCVPGKGCIGGRCLRPGERCP
jgi:hypothetical protein